MPTPAAILVPEVLNPQWGQLAAPWTTYRVGGPLEVAFFPDSTEAALAILRHWNTLPPSYPLTVLGWGSNSIVASAGIKGGTLITRKMQAQTQLDDIRFEIGAGVHLAKIATLAQQHSLTGAEYMIGIPATLGGAVRMNAGALGQETSQIIESVTLYNRTTQQQEVWPVAQLNYRYRYSGLDPACHVVLAAVVRFAPGDKATITQRMTESVAFRKAHHPTDPNGGSVFQNPSKTHTAGAMLDQLGAKTQGWRVGDAMVSPLHANFIVNVGQASSLDVLQLMLKMKQAVKAEFGFDLHPENKLLGAITEEEAAIWQLLLL
jgi:UDP-N-acetylmuramate dehydrogenase